MSILSIILLIGLFIMNIWLKQYFKTKSKNFATKNDVKELTYLSEKGKNLATSEDIQNITLKIESVKRDLDVITSSKIAFANEERNTLIKTYESIVSYKEFLFSLEISSFSQEFDYYFYLSKIEEKNYLWVCVYSKLRLFIDDNLILTQYFEMDRILLNARTIISDYIFDVAKTHTLYAKYFYAADNITENYEPGKLTEYYELIKVIFAKRNEKLLQINREFENLALKLVDQTRNKMKNVS